MPTHLVVKVHTEMTVRWIWDKYLLQLNQSVILAGTGFVSSWSWKGSFARKRTSKFDALSEQTWKARRELVINPHLFVKRFSAPLNKQ